LEGVDINELYTINRMKNFPEDFELISFFESEPKVLDTDIPWFYNTLTFSLTKGNENLIVHISPAYGDLEIYLHQKGELKLNWRFYQVIELIIDRNKSSECLRIISEAENMAESLLFINPSFKLIGGMAINN